MQKQRIENALIILNTKLANILLDNNCKLLRIGVNTKYPNRDVYYFEPTEKANLLKEEFQKSRQK